MLEVTAKVQTKEGWKILGTKRVAKDQLCFLFRRDQRFSNPDHVVTIRELSR